MKNLTALLERARRQRVDRDKPVTWYRLAKDLGITQARLWGWRHGSVPDNNGALLLAAQLKMPLQDVIGYLEEDRAKKLKDAEATATWSARLPRLLPSLAIASAGLVAATSVTLSAGTYETATKIAALPAIHYAKYRSDVSLGIPKYKGYGSLGSLILGFYGKLPKDSVFVFVRVCIDDCSTHKDPKAPMMLCGTVATVSQWDRFDKAWGKQLRRAGLFHFHAKEFINCPDHQKVSRAAVAYGLTGLLQTHIKFAFVTVLKREDFEWYRSGPQRLNTLLESDFGVSFRLVLSFLHIAVSEIIPTATAVFLVVERGHENCGAADVLLSRIRKELPDTLIQSPVTLVNKEDCYGTQASDLIAMTLLRTEERPGRKNFSPVPRDDLLSVPVVAKPRIFRLPMTREMLEEMRDRTILSRPSYLKLFGDQVSSARRPS